MSLTPEKDKYLNWVAKRKDTHGLIAVHVSVSSDADTVPEEFYRELNNLNELIDTGQAGNDHVIDEEDWL